jgi:hypothetical protein
MKITRFKRKRDLIIVNARVWSPLGRRRLRLAIDTGSADTVVTPDIVERLGYSVRDGEHVMTIRSRDR